MYNLEFTSEELILLENVLKKPIKPNNNTDKITLCFNQEELESMEKILETELCRSFDLWYDLCQKQKRTFFKKDIKPTVEMSKQWKYTGRIEEIYNRIATPIGRSKRASLEELEEFL